MKKFLNINTILIAAVLILGIAGFVYSKITAQSGAKAIVHILNNGEESIMEIDLSKDDTYTIQTNYTVTLDVKDGAIAFIHSQCPDKLCEGFGYISQDGLFASCLPAGVVVTVEGNE